MSRPLELAWLHLEVADLDLWRRYLSQVLGLHVEARAPGLVARIDDREGRLYLSEGPRDDLAGVGWCLDGAGALDAALARARELGASPEESTEAATFGVDRMVRLRDPAGIPVALVEGQRRTEAPLELLSDHQGFVAGDLGLGHLVLRTLDKARSRAFYEDLLDIRHSDQILTEIAGHPVDIDFFHVPSQPGGPSRHHSVALGGPMPKRLHHFMLECRSVDDVGATYDRMVRLCLPIFQTLGRHPNDRMLSFYAVTPSGFQVEVGWGGRLVDDDTWTPTVMHRISEWGHHHPTRFRPRPPRLEGWPA